MTSMRIPIAMMLWTIVHGMAIAVAQAASPPVEKDSKLSEGTKKPPPVIFYAPPVRGAPKASVGGGTRGPLTTRVVVAMAPDHLALTVAKAPRLYWFASGAVGGKYEVALIDVASATPVFRQSLGEARRRGVQVIDLAEWKVSLAVDREYRWTVNIVPESSGGSDRPGASALIMRVAPDSQWLTRLDGMSLRERAVALARRGLWYDAFDAVQRLRTEDPAEAVARRMEEDLIAQAGLAEVVEAISRLGHR